MSLLFEQHIATAFHVRSKASRNLNDENTQASSNTFKTDLYTALVAGNMPWNVLSNATFNNLKKERRDSLITYINVTNNPFKRFATL